MRARNSQEKAQIAQSLHEHVWPLLAQGKCLPQIYKTYDFQMYKVPMHVWSKVTILERSF